MNQRIKQVRVTLKITQADFAAKVGLTKSAISLIESGDRNPSEPVIRAICHEFGVSTLWLRNGEGDMFVPDEAQLRDTIDRLMDGENEFAKSVFRAFAQLDASEWETMKKLFDEIVKASANQ